jgi:hypothetical protein
MHRRRRRGFAALGRGEAAPPGSLGLMTGGGFHVKAGPRAAAALRRQAQRQLSANPERTAAGDQGLILLQTPTPAKRSR